MINKGSSLVIEPINDEYVNIFVFSQLSASSYIELLNKLKNSIKGLINIKNNYNKCFLWCLIRLLTIADKKWLIILVIKALNFLPLKKIFGKIKKKKKFFINLFCYENYLVYPVCVSIERFENCMDLLMITDKNKSHYLYIKDFNRFICNKTKYKNKKHFCKYCYNVLVLKMSCKSIKKLV